MIIEKNGKKYEVKGDGFGLSETWVYYPAQKVLLRATGFNDWYDTEKSDFNDDCPEDVKKQILENIIIFDLNDQDEAFNAVHSLSRSMFMEGVQEIRNQFKLLMEIDNIG